MTSEQNEPIEADAIYERGTLRLAAPLDLPDGAAVRLTISLRNGADVGADDDRRPTDDRQPTDDRAPTAEGQAPIATARPSTGSGQVVAAISPRAMVALAGAIGLAILAQLAIAGGSVPLGVIGLALAVAGAAFGARGPAWPDRLPGRMLRQLPEDWRFWLTIGAILAAAVAFANATGNRYRPINVIPWLATVACFWAASADWRWAYDPAHPLRRLRQPGALRAYLTRERLIILGLLIAILAVGAAFRYNALFDNPRDFNSDQAEKLLDVNDVLNGTFYIFFERNTGREPWQFYWTAAIVRLLGIPADYMALKIGTSLIGWLMLPAIFLLAREVLGSRAALIATLFAAAASWGVITARFGLRYPLAPCAVAWTLAFLVRGLRRDSRSDMLLAGVWIGIGLQGYTSYRFMIVVVPMIVGLWCGWLWLQRRPELIRRALSSFALSLVLAFLVMLPLIRYGVERPDQLFYRAATRLTSAEQQIEGEPLLIFLDNLKNVLLMFNYTADEVWVANIPTLPAMDPLLGGLLVVGAAATLALSWRTRNPWPALMLLTGLAMLLPSALSIAFPKENPSVVRTGGALPALMIVCAAAPALLIEGLRSLGRPRLYQGGLAGVAILALLIVQVNWERVFAIYPEQYCPRAQNASDMGRELSAWLAAGGERRNAWIVGYPHWVDSRAVGVWIGEITFPNTVIGPEQVGQVDLGGQPGIFLLNRDDIPSLQTLYTKYPQGQERLVEGSLCAGKAFLLFETAP